MENRQYLTDQQSVEIFYNKKNVIKMLMFFNHLAQRDDVFSRMVKDFMKNNTVEVVKQIILFIIDVDNKDVNEKFYDNLLEHLKLYIRLIQTQYLEVKIFDTYGIV